METTRPNHQVAQTIETRSAKWAYPALFLGSVVDSTIFPWLIELPLTALMLRGRAHVFPAAITVWAGSVLGYVIMFAAGAWAFEAASAFLAGRVDWLDQVQGARDTVTDRAAWPVFVSMFTPAPQIVSFAAGAAGLSVQAFLLACLVGRALRYGSMAILVFFFGEQIITWWRRLPLAVRIGVIVALVAAFAASLIHGFT